MKSEITIAALKHRVQLCSMQDVVIEAEGMRLIRTEAFKAWAAIETKSGSMFAKEGVVIDEPLSRQSHLITIRYRHDFVISSAAWLYEERRKSEPRWYKVLKVKEADCEWWVLSCRLVEKSDLISKPQEPGTANAEEGFLVQLPPGVKL